VVGVGRDPAPVVAKSPTDGKLFLQQLRIAGTVYIRDDRSDYGRGGVQFLSWPPSDVSSQRHQLPRMAAGMSAAFRGVVAFRRLLLMR
jgi:hypothetical protein